jgi:hypothetical protein
MEMGSLHAVSAMICNQICKRSENRPDAAQPVDSTRPILVLGYGHFEHGTPLCRYLRYLVRYASETVDLLDSGQRWSREGQKNRVSCPCLASTSAFVPDTSFEPKGFRRPGETGRVCTNLAKPWRNTNWRNRLGFATNTGGTQYKVTLPSVLPTGWMTVFTLASTAMTCHKLSEFQVAFEGCAPGCAKFKRQYLTVSSSCAL